MYDSRQDTLNHKYKVRGFLKTLNKDIVSRSHNHDISKLDEPEKSVFDEYTPKLAGSTYGSEEYKEFLKEMKVALDHHYLKNRHHPEHFQNGINDMTLIDLCEMLADWKAATLRHNNGDIFKSLELNQERFGYSDELKQILINTARVYFE